VGNSLLIRLVSLALIIAHCLLCKPQRGPLLQRATQWDVRADSARPVDYAWISNHELLLCLSGQEDPGSIFYIHDLNKGTEKPLKVLSRWFKNTDGDGAGGDRYFYLSLDRKWVAWNGDERNPAPNADPEYENFTYTSALDGTHYTRWATGGGELRWAADSRHLMVFEPGFLFPPSGHSQLLIGSISAPARLQTIPIASSSPLNRHLDTSKVWFLSEKLALLPSLRDTDLLLPEPSFSTPEILPEIQAVAIASNKQLLRKYPIRLPIKAEIKDVVFSPQGDRLAWELVTRQNASPLASQPHHPLPRWPLPPITSVSLWVSQIDGTRMHEIGSIQAPQALKESQGLDLLGDIQWVPGGKRLSFFYQNALWTVPAG